MIKRGIIFVLLVAILVLRFYFNFAKEKPYKDGDKVKIVSKITSEPIRYQNSQYLKIKGLKIYLPLYPEINYGDKVILEGIVERDRLKNARLIEVKENVGFLYKFREKLIDFYFSSLPEPNSALVAGVTLGSKTNIPNDFWESLKNTGTAHVVVASGMNVTLIAGFLIGVLVLLLPRRKAILLALAGIWIYAFIAGFDAPIIRASIMGSLAFIAQEVGRLNISIRTLFTTGFIMLFLKPEWINDLGFLLSFFATLSLIVLESKVYKLIHFIPENLKVIKKDFSTSLSASFGVFPILFFGFRQFNLLSPLINTGILWTIVPITIIGGLGGLIGMIYEPLGKLILWLIYPLTLWFVGLVQFFG